MGARILDICKAGDDFIEQVYNYNTQIFIKYDVVITALRYGQKAAAIFKGKNKAGKVHWIQQHS